MPSQIKTARIKPGSALEQLLRGRSFTELIHELADREMTRRKRKTAAMNAKPEITDWP